MNVAGELYAYIHADCSAPAPEFLSSAPRAAMPCIAAVQIVSVAAVSRCDAAALTDAPV
jgi:hypothetical protein